MHAMYPDCPYVQCPWQVSFWQVSFALQRHSFAFSNETVIKIHSLAAALALYRFSSILYTVQQLHRREAVASQ